MSSQSDGFSWMDLDTPHRLVQQDQATDYGSAVGQRRINALIAC